MFVIFMNEVYRVNFVGQVFSFINLFFLLFQISPEHEKALTLITYIGCGISLFGLALTLATFLSLEYVTFPV